MFKCRFVNVKRSTPSKWYNYTLSQNWGLHYNHAVYSSLKLAINVLPGTAFVDEYILSF